MHQAHPGITEAQREAVSEAMRAILEDDLRRPEAVIQFRCAGCVESRPGAGAIDYEGTRLCHACATEYEVARVSGALRSPAEFVARTWRSRPAPTR
jgi:hypothetical protein